MEYDDMPADVRRMEREAKKEDENIAQLTTPDGKITVEVGLRPNGVVRVTVSREGELAQNRLLGPDVDWDD